MDKVFATIPEQLINFVLVTVFSLLIGLSQRKIQMRKDDIASFGSDRTFTLIGILGFILYILDTNNYVLFAGGGLALALILGASYIFRVYKTGIYGVTSVVIALITYSLAPIVCTQPTWLYIAVVVVVLVITEMKEEFTNFTKQMNDKELITLAKFLIISGIILPILPKEQLIQGVNLTPYNIWLATVVISCISYVSYLLKKFVFKGSGIIVSGILGGMYSSTATTIVMSKKSKTDQGNESQYAAAIILATAMMYIRVLALVVIFNRELLAVTWYYFLIMFVVSIAVATAEYYYKKKKATTDDTIEAPQTDTNPLEFKVALIFAFLFVVFTVVTYYTLQYFGSAGLRWLSVIVGATDVDPFLISLLQGRYAVEITAIAAAIFTALISNNIMKAIYAVSFSGKQQKELHKRLIAGFAVITVINIIIVIIL